MLEHNGGGKMTTMSMLTGNC